MEMFQALAVLTCVFGTEPAEPLRTWNYEKPVKAVAVAPKGDYLVVAAGDQTYIQPMEGKATKLAEREYVSWISFDPEGDRIALSGDEKLQVFERDGSTVYEEETRSRGALAANGKIIAHAHEAQGDIVLTRLADRKQMRKFHTGFNFNPWVDFSISPDGRFLSGIDDQGNVRVHEIASSKERWRKAEYKAGVAMHVEFAAHGRSFATWYPFRPREVVLWDTVTGQVRARRKVPEGDFHAWELSPNGRVVAATQKGRVRYFALGTGEELPGIRTASERMNAISHVPNGAFIAVGDNEGRVCVYAVPRSDRLPELDREQLAACWDDLNGKDGERVFRSQEKLCDDPVRSVPYLKSKLVESLRESDEAAIRQLVAQLDDNDFRKREQAADRIRDLGVLAEPHLRKVLEGGMSNVELRRRVERLLDHLNVDANRMSRSFARAVEILEIIGTEEAVAALNELVKRGADAGWTLDVERALERMTRNQRSAKFFSER